MLRVRLVSWCLLLHRNSYATFCTEKNVKKVKRANKVKAIRGMHDLLPNEFRVQQFIVDKARDVTRKFGFEAISTPIVEDLDLFVRAIGSDTDVVSKELFSWDQSSQKVALRPEGTAGVLRSIISPAGIEFNQNLPKISPQRVFYAGTMFRHERPQKGRYRQFTQVGVEWIGDGAAGALSDIQMISVAFHFLTTLRIPFQLKINSIGKLNDREEYTKVLKKYYEENDSELSETSRNRVKFGNVLRILDSKDVGDRSLSAAAPKIIDYLKKESIENFEKVKVGLDELGIPFSVDQNLVRGLDYYNDVVFEFIHAPNQQEYSNTLHKNEQENKKQNESSRKLGKSQDTILAGGRYDSLCSNLGGPDICAVGWAAGVERLSILLNEEIMPKTKRPVFIIIPKEENEKIQWKIQVFALKLIHEILHDSSVTILLAGDGSMSKQFARANKHNAIGAIIIGTKEMKQNKVQVKILDDSTEFQVSIDDLTTFIHGNFHKE